MIRTTGGRGVGDRVWFGGWRVLVPFVLVGVLCWCMVWLCVALPVVVVEGVPVTATVRPCGCGRSR